MRKLARITAIAATALVALSFLALIYTTVFQRSVFNIPMGREIVVPYGPMFACFVLLFCTVILIFRTKADTTCVKTEISLLICMLAAVPLLYAAGYYLTFCSFCTNRTTYLYISYMNGSFGAYWSELHTMLELFFKPAELGLALGCVSCGVSIGCRLQKREEAQV